MTTMTRRAAPPRIDSDRASEWRDRAVCADADPEIFTPLPADVATILDALSYCDRCPVKAACLADAFEHGDLHTIRGGQTPEERAAVLRQKAADKPTSGRGFAAARAARADKRGGKCGNGLHEMTPENTYTHNGYSVCAPCRVENQRQYRLRLKERGRQARELAEVTP